MTQIRNSHRQAIQTKYHGPSNVRGARVSATCQAGRIIKSWDHSLNVSDNHDAAVSTLLAKLKWEGEWIGAGVASSGYCYVDATP